MQQPNCKTLWLLPLATTTVYSSVDHQPEALNAAAMIKATNVCVKNQTNFGVVTPKKKQKNKNKPSNLQTHQNVVLLDVLWGATMQPTQ